MSNNELITVALSEPRETKNYWVYEYQGNSFGKIYIPKDTNPDDPGNLTLTLTGEDNE